MIDVRTLSIDRPWLRPRSLEAYLLAGLIVALATAVQAILSPSAADIPFVTFFPAVIIVTFLSGSAAGTLATALSLLAAWLFILPTMPLNLAIDRSALFGVGTLTIAGVVRVMRIASAYLRRANEALLSSEGKFRGLLESAPDAMVIVDDERRVALVNAQAESLFGYPRAALAGQPIERLIADRDREHYLAQFAAFAGGPGRTSHGQVIALHALRADRSEFPIDVRFGRLDTETEVLVSNAIRDVTARREIEANLAQASQAKSDFLANMSHELRTPLNAIIGFSEMIRDAIIGPLDARYREYGADINQSGRHLRNIINDILDISKIESGSLTLRDEIVSIAESVESCRRVIAPMAANAGVRLAVDVPASLPPIRSDQVRFQQILLNIISNAVKFTPAGGHVRVSAALAADGVTVAVEDTGIGMKQDDIAVALEPFRQIEGPLSRRFDGTGLGLPLAKALVELHGGRLEIASTPGAGTTVRIHVPSTRITSVAA